MAFDQFLGKKNKENKATRKTRTSQLYEDMKQQRQAVAKTVGVKPWVLDAVEKPYGGLPTSVSPAITAEDVEERRRQAAAKIKSNATLQRYLKTLNPDDYKPKPGMSTSTEETRRQTNLNTAERYYNQLLARQALPEGLAYGMGAARTAADLALDLDPKTMAAKGYKDKVATAASLPEGLPPQTAIEAAKQEVKKRRMAMKTAGKAGSLVGNQLQKLLEEGAGYKRSKTLWERMYPEESLSDNFIAPRLRRE